MMRLSRIVLGVVVVCGGALANADPPLETTNAPRGVGRLFAMPSGGVSVEEALRALEEEQESLRFTDADETPFQLEVGIISTGARPDGFDSHLDYLLEKNGEVASRLTRDDRQAPLVLQRNAHGFWLDHPGEWRHRTRAPWFFSVDAGRIVSRGVADEAPKRSHEFQIDLFGLLKHDFRDRIVEIVWDAPTRELAMQRADGSLILLRMRSPDDAVRYGSVWGRIIVQDGPTYMVFTAFVRGRSDLLLPASTAEEIAQAIDASKSDEFARDLTELDRESPEQDAAAQAMEATLASAPYRRPRIVAARAAIDVAYRGILEQDELKHDPERDFAPATPEDVKTLVDVKSLLRTTTFNVRLRLDADEAATLAPIVRKSLGELADAIANDLNGYPDDPSMIWREAQARFGAMRLFHFIQLFVSNLLLDGSTFTRSDRASLCDALFDLGEPPSSRLETRWDFDGAFRQDPFLDVLIRVHRLEGIRDEHREVCLAELRAAEAGSTLECLAVEMLLRIDEPPPEEHGAVERWWNSEIVEANRGRRLRSLAVLSSGDFGRKLILKRLRDELSDDVRRDIVQALTARIDAADRTGREEAIHAEQRAALRKELAEIDASVGAGDSTTP